MLMTVQIVNHTAVEVMPKPPFSCETVKHLRSTGKAPLGSFHPGPGPSLVRRGWGVGLEPQPGYRV